MKSIDENMRGLTLCADDFGLNKPVNEGITDLVAKGKLNAVSIMTGGKSLETGLPELLKACEKSPIRVTLGLHITLTEYEPLTDIPSLAPGGIFPTISSLLVKSHLGLLNAGQIETEIESQIARFEKIVGQKPGFMDGHQHAHILPFIRRNVLKSAKNHLSPSGWVRSCCEGQHRFENCFKASLKQNLLAFLSHDFKNVLIKEKIKSNDFFHGINNFSRSESYPALFRQWLAKAKTQKGKQLIMCHPARGIEKLLKTECYKAAADPIGERRLDEFSYFSSSAFDEDLQTAGFSLSKVQD